MSSSGFSAKFTITYVTPNGADFDVYGDVNDGSGVYTALDVAEGDVVYIDISNSPIDNAWVSRFVVASVLSLEPTQVYVTLHHDVPGALSVPNLSDYVYQPAIIGRSSAILKTAWLAADDLQGTPKYLHTYALDLEKFNNLDNPSGGFTGSGATGPQGLQGVTGPSGGGSGGGATGVQGATGLPGTSGGKWAPGKAYAAGSIVFSDGLAFSSLSSHTSSSTFTQDLDKWESMDNRAWVGLQAAHGFTGLQPAYQDSTGAFLKARADAAATLATHLVLHSSANYLLAVSGGDFTYTAHGLTGVECCSPTVAGAMTPVQPDPTLYYINQVVAVSTTDVFRVVSEQPAYYRW
jgi:hypothetical protein